jgi:hypothetical protein
MLVRPSATTLVCPKHSDSLLSWICEPTEVARTCPTTVERGISHWCHDQGAVPTHLLRLLQRHMKRPILCNGQRHIVLACSFSTSHRLGWT